MTDTKKKWVKPELTVLLRSKPEEAVLDACKVDVVMGNPHGDFVWCMGLDNDCRNCTGSVGS